MRRSRHGEEADQDEQDDIPLHHKRAFGSGLKRKKVEFVRAQDPDDYITTLEEASTLLKLDELKNLGKEARIRGKNKQDLIRKLRRTSQKQSGLGWANLKRSDTENSVDEKSPAEIADGTIFPEQRV